MPPEAAIRLIAAHHDHDSPLLQVMIARLIILYTFVCLDFILCRRRRVILMQMKGEPLNNGDISLIFTFCRLITRFIARLRRSRHSRHSLSAFRSLFSLDSGLGRILPWSAQFTYFCSLLFQWIAIYLAVDSPRSIWYLNGWYVLRGRSHDRRVPINGRPSTSSPTHSFDPLGSRPCVFRSS